MIVYYKKNTKEIKGTCPSSSKKHLDDEQLEAELNDMFPSEKNNMGVSRFDEDEEIQIGGTWDEKNNKMTAPYEPEVTPEQERFVELQNKFENQSATLKEVQEYLFLRDK